MVIIKEINNNMFWGVTVDGGKRYSQMVEKSFHVSMAALEPTSAKECVSVMIRHENTEFLLCSLNPKSLLQQTLDLNFTEGEEVAFFLTGSGIVHLTGFLVEDEEEADMTDYGEMMDSAEDSSDEDEPELIPLSQTKSKKNKDIKRKLESNFNSSSAKKKKNISADADSNEDSDELNESFIDDEAEDDSDVEDSDEVPEDEYSEEEEITQSQKKKKKKDKQDKKSETPKQQSNSTPNRTSTPNSDKPAESGDATLSKKKKKKKKKNKDNTLDTSASNKAESTPKEKVIPIKRVMAGGTVIEEVKVGHGPEAKPGKMVHVYYRGKLQSGKEFDSCMSGKPFRFKLGKSEVIKGWDNGLTGMKVGGKRKITVPPQQGYGNQRQGPIPANSTLVFDVELKAVS